MLKKFVPNSFINSYKELDIDDLKDKGIKLLICDIDNTLVPHDEPNTNQEVSNFISKVLNSGLNFCFISNNTLERVSIFAKDYDVNKYSFAKKPLRNTYKKIFDDYNVNPNEVACLGDQLLTDILGGNRVGIYTILCNPLVEKDLLTTKLNRKIESVILKMLENRNMFKKGDNNEKEV